MKDPTEAPFRLLFEANPLPMWVYGCDTLRFLKVNEAAVALYGYSRDEFLELRITDIRPPEDIPLLERNLARERTVLERSGPWRHRTKDNRIFEVEVSSHLIDWYGRRASFVVAQDIGDRRRAEKSLSESEERFRAAFEYAPFGMCLTALNGRYLQVNAALSKMLGYSEAELLGDAFQNVTHPDDRARSQRAVEQFTRDKAQSVEFEKRYIHKQGHTIWVRLKISVVNNAEGRPSYFIAHVDDITASRQAERALHESEEKYRSLITHIPDMVWAADAEGQVEFVSPNVERLMGLSATEAYECGSQALFQHVHPEDAQRIRESFQALFSRGKPYDVEFRVRARSGDWVWVHDRAVATYQREGRFYASGLRSDISERRRAEAAVRERDAAQESNRTKSTFLAHMSHELRTPLNAIIGYSEMLLEDYIGADQPEVRGDLERIERSGRSLLAIINDVLDLSKIEAQRAEVRIETVDVAGIAQDVFATVAPLSRQQGNTLSLDCPEQARFAHADLAKLRQSLLNLVNNACKFTQNGQVSVVVARVPGAGGGWIEIRVRDTGVGIPPAHMSQLFEPFSQVDDGHATRKFDGTGLGLAISKKFCELMGGDISVESTLGKGSCFTIRVPGAPCRQ